MKTDYSRLYRWGFLCLVLLFISCENFLTGKDVAQELNEVIAYSNAPSSRLVLNAPEGTGSFLSGSEKNCKVGYTIEVQFTVNSKDYVYGGMEAVSKSNPAISRTDYVQFTDLSTETEKQNGTYKVQVKLLKQSDDIMIRPVCVLIPKVTSAWPPNDNTSYPQDSSIKVNFNKVIKLSDFADENGNLKNITIKNGNRNLLDLSNGNKPYYKSPYLENDGKTLVIPIVKGNYIITDNSSVTEDIQVILMLSGLTDEVEGEKIPFNQSEYKFQYSLDSRKDSTAPVFNTLRIACTKEDAENGTNLITMDKFTHYADNENYGGDSSIVAQNIQNHHVNKIWIYFEAEDADSGVAFLEIKEQLIYDNNCEEIIGAPTYDKSNCLNTNCIINSTEDKVFSSCIEYDFFSSDGIVRLDFVLNDFAGQTTTCTNDFVKDTSCRLNVKFVNSELKFIEDFEDPHCVPYNIKLDLVIGSNEYSYNTFATDLNGKIYNDTFVLQDENNLAVPGQIVSFAYGYDKNNMTVIDLKDAEYDIEDAIYLTNNYYGKKKQFFVNVLVNPYKKLYLEAVLEDSIGNTYTVSDEIPPVPDTIGVEITEKSYGETLNFITNRPANHGIIRGCDSDYQEEIDTSYNLMSNKYDRLPETISISYHSSKTYYGKSLKLQKFLNGDKKTWKILTETSQNSSLTTNDIPPFSVNVDNPINGNKKFVQVNYDSTFNFNPSYYYLICCGNNIISETTFELSYSITPAILKIRVYDGNGNYIESEPYEIDCSFDNIAPIVTSFVLNKIVHGCCIASITMTDGFYQPWGMDCGNSGIKELKYFFSNKLIDKDSIDWENDERLKVPELLSMSNNNYTYVFEYNEYTPNYIYLYAKDNNENYTTFYAPLSIQKADLSLTINSENNKIIETSPAQCTLFNDVIISNKWKSITSVENDYGSIQLSAESYDSTLHIYSSEIDLTDDEKESFIRVIPKYPYYNSSYGLITYTDSVIYYYPAYEIAKNTSSPIECDLKDFYLGNSGINILADQPCFAHTLYFVYDLGNTSQVWIDNGFETGLVMKKKSFTYSYENTSSVPSGYYYTTIVHFADGTMLMTPVQQKGD